ncbi:Cloroperoxidase [Teratosphaeria nubilosa]|uniref:Cloroperoxidase n=1 Tax=Teratosphaeria nubilosa TaxID=161662 RepID=A0A6G1KXL3_9PEZI|nr:Cloroperoxidase [Teratosphaeria nubilosa]
MPCSTASAAAYPWVVHAPDVDSSLLPPKTKKTIRTGKGLSGPAYCPYNPDHVAAAPVTSEYPYNGAINGEAGKGIGNYLVPDPNDTAHAYVAPGPNDIRGPCPGLNTAANHNFLSHDGIVTYNELVDAQQNVYNVGYGLANLLAVLGLITTDGDIVNEKLSIGCDATNFTSFDPTLTGSEPGLDGHNKFEADASLSRNDFFTHDGDDFSYNQTLFDMMSETTDNSPTQQSLAKYRQRRYQESLANNPNFFYGPLALLQYGAASFLYELMPSVPPGSADGRPDYASVKTFFEEERIPDNWYTRGSPYSNIDVTTQIVEMYLDAPVVFGGNVGNGTLAPISFGSIQDGKIPSDISAADTLCLLYQLALGPVPSSLNGLITPTVDALSFAATKLSPMFANLGCPTALT